jgi:hypothetical protein
MASYSLAEIYEVSVEFAAFIFMVGDGSSEFLRIFMNAWHRMPEDSRFHGQKCENPKTRIKINASLKDPFVRNSFNPQTFLRAP